MRSAGTRRWRGRYESEPAPSMCLQGAAASRTRPHVRARMPSPPILPPSMSDPILRAAELTKIVTSGEVAADHPRRRELRRRGRRVGRDRRRVGLGQDDAARPARGARPADARARSGSTASRSPALDEDARAALRQRLLGFVFQSFQLLPALTALENVMLPLELAGAPDAAARARDWLGARRPRAAHDALPEAALRRRAAARGDRARVRRRAQAADGRRADRQSRRAPPAPKSPTSCSA